MDLKLKPNESLKNKTPPTGIKVRSKNLLYDMLNINYAKEYSFRNKHSPANQVVIDKLNQLKAKAKNNNEIRILVMKRVTLDFPYSLEIIQKDINENDAVIQINISVKLQKIFILYLITSVAVGLILGYFIGSYLVLIPVILNVLVLFYFGKISATKFTERMVEGWLK